MTVDELALIRADAEKNAYNLIDTAETCISEPHPREYGDVYDEGDNDDGLGPSDDAVPAVLLK